MSRWSIVTSYGVVVEPPLRLTLGYGALPPWTYPLFPKSDWLDLGRYDDPNAQVIDSNAQVIRLPSFVAAVPRGALLLIRYWCDSVSLRRSTARPEYVVWLDGHALVPEQPVALRDRGHIQYGQDGVRSTVLSYRLDERRSDDDR
jgi:hypothetical protein